MRPQILVASLVKNEAAKFLPSAVKAWGDFADKVLVIDDHSQDESVLVAKAAGAEVISSNQTSSMWGEETPLRTQLWKESLKRTKPGDFIFVLDADMVPAKDPRPLINEHTDGIAFPLYDLWYEDEYGMYLYREDHFWKGHKSRRMWMVKRPSEENKWQWSGRGIHSGHFPENLNVLNPVFAPEDFALLHYAYISDALRYAKFQKYAEVGEQLNEFERLHAQSIVDTLPRLRPLEFTPTYRLQCES